MAQIYLMIYAGKPSYTTDKPGINSHALGKVYDGLLQVFRVDMASTKVYRLVVSEGIRSYGSPYWVENWIEVENRCLK